MARKWNIELIQQYLDENHNGYRVFGEYINVKSKLTFICPDGHESNKTFSDFKETKNKCNECRLIEKGKIHLERFYKSLNESNYTLIRFTGNRRVVVQCPSAHSPYEVSTSNFYSGKRCPQCFRERFANERKHSYEYVKNYIESFGYTLHSEEYINNETHLDVSCDNGHPPYPVIFNNFHKGYRCPYCAGNKKVAFDEIKMRVENHGYKLLTTFDEYENTSTRLKVICPNNHVTFKYLNTLDSGKNCWECAIIGRSGENSSSWKGGISSINEYLRKHINEWKQASLKEYNYLCNIEKTNVDLEIHHLIPFSDLVINAFEITKIEIRDIVNQYSNEELDILKKVLLKLHMQKLGVPLNKEVHFLFHQIFGYHNTNEEQYIFFKNHYTKFKSGEFTIQDYKNHIRKE